MRRFRQTGASFGGWHRARVAASGCLVAAVVTGIGSFALAPASQARPVVGPAASISLVLSSSTVTADGSSTVTAKATVTDAGGTPVPGETVDITSSDSGESISPTPATDNHDGTYTATITASTTAGPVTITASDTSTAGITPATAPLTQTPGPPAHITLSLNPTTIPADGSSTSTAIATVTDAHSNPVRGQIVDISSSDSGDAISPTPATDNGDGTYTATITSSITVGTPTITATDAAAGLSASQPLDQTPGSPSSIGLTLAASTIVVGSTTTATATVTDTSGHPLSGLPVAFSSSDPGDSISPTTDKGGGHYTARITASTVAGQATITASVGGVSNTVTLTQVPGPAAQVALTLNPPVIAADGASISLAIAGVTDRFGNAISGDPVHFTSSNPGDRVIQQPPNGTVYAASIISSTRPGSYTITATDTKTGVSQAQTLKEVAGTSSTSLVITPASGAATNEPVTLFATVDSSGGTADGAVSFLVNTFLPIAGCTNLPVSYANPAAGCQASFAASQSPVSISAVFTPDLSSTVAGSSTAGSLTVGRDPTSTSLGTSSPAPTVDGTETYTAFVVPANQGSTAPGGAVEFESRGKPIGSCASVPVHASGGASVASCTVRYTTTGARRVSAVYGGDSNFTGSASGAVQVSVQPLGRINAAMQWLFAFSPSYTTVSSMVVNGVSLGTKVIVICKGRGCPFARRTSALAAGVRCSAGKRHCRSRRRGPVSLTGAFHRHRLAVGTRITIEIRRAGWVGKYYSFVMRSGSAPQVRISCLAPGQSKPGVGC